MGFRALCGEPLQESRDPAAKARSDYRAKLAGPAAASRKAALVCTGLLCQHATPRLVDEYYLSLASDFPCARSA
jgi:hypothetical protein